MSMIDELGDTTAGVPGPKCAVQHLRKDDEPLARDVLDTMQARGYTSIQKQEVLLKHGYDFNRLFIERHMRGECQGCLRWDS